MENKQIKLYTEEQVKRAINIADESPDLLGYDEILYKLEPIKLPSDEEIDNELPNHLERGYVNGFYDGVKWVIEQIKQQADGK